MAFELLLGRVIAISMVVGGLAMIVNRNEFAKMAQELKKSSITRLIGGHIDLFVGLFLVLGHNLWTNDWRIIITILGWLALLEGMLLLFFPHLSIKYVQLWKNTAVTYVTALLMIAVGIYLTIVTFF